MEKPTGSSASGAKEKIEKQARQLAYDTRYKVRQSMNKGTKMNPAQVSKAYMSQLAKSSAAPAVKARAKQMLLGEDLIDTKRLATDTVVSALYKVFVEGVQEEVVVEENEYLQQLNEMEEKKYKIRVTDKKTGNTYVRMATRAKIAELRANPNISSVEMTQYGDVSKSEKLKGAATAKAKSGKGLDPVGQEDKDIDNDGDHDKSDKYLMKRRKAVGKAIATRKEDYNWQDGFAELIEKKKEEGEKKITGEGVNNTKLIKVFPDENSGIKEETEQQAPDKKQDLRKKQTVSNQKKILMAKLQQLNKGIPLSQEELEVDAEIISEREMTAGEMKKEKELKKKYDPSGMKSSMTKQYGKEKGKQVYFATIRKQAMGEENCGCEVDKEPKLKKSEGGEEDPRSIPTKVNLVKNKLRSMGLKMDYEPEGEVIDERRKEDKVAGTPRKPRNPAFELVAKSMGTGRMGVKPRGQKKVPGKKPPAAGEYGAPASPAQKVEKIRAARKRAQDMMHSPRD